jgi:serine/threonine-protein kinase
LDESRVAHLITLFERALDVPQARRSEFLEQVCSDDANLRQELSSLLRAHESAPAYFDHLAEELVSPAYTAIAGTAAGKARVRLLSQLQSALGNKYSIVQELGGGMSRVFLAEETKLGRKVVIKVLPAEMAASASAERFRREIQVAAQLQHPHIVPLLTSDVADSLLYYTMPFVAGESLRQRLARDGALPLAEARTIWRDVLDALAHAHANAVIHRDIKPANILLSGRSALVSDFGIARAMEAAGGDARQTATGLSIGTPAYMAPEQVTGDKDADQRVDIYAAGLVMYEMLEGQLPFPGDSIREVILARLTRDPSPITRADCPPQLARLVARCLANEPAARPQTVEMVLTELETIPTTTHAVQPKRPRRVLIYGSAALVLAAASFGVRQQLRTGHVSTAAKPEASLAVLPLENFSTGADDAALADGVTEELITMLAGAGPLRVTGSTSVFAFKGQRMDARQIAESLHVSHILEGGLQKVGQRLRVQAQLVDARDGSTRWSGTYDREMGEIFAVQDSIVRAVMRTLDGAAVGAGSNRAHSTIYPHTPKIDAYEWYLRGLALKRGGATERTLAREYFSRAIAADSTFAAAHAALTRVYIDDAGATPGDYRESYARAEQAAQKAVALDDSLAAAHAALGWAYSINRKWASAQTELRRAITLDPRASDAYEGLALVYQWTERPRELLAVAKTGLEIDPFNYSAVRRMALALSMNNRCDEAIQLLRPLQTLSAPAEVAGVITGQCYATKKMWPEAIAEFRWAMTDGSKGRARMALAFLGYAQARAGQRDEARRILSDLRTGRQYSHGAFGIATIYAGLGVYDSAFVWLDRAADEGSLRPYIMGPMFEDLRREPRFARFKKRIGF